jgi:acyl dehydratase
MTGGFSRVVAADFEVGQSSPVVVIEDLSRRDIAQYAGASGDFNPIHYNDVLAKEAGNKSVFAHGMLSAGFVSRMICEWFGIENIQRFSSRFQARVWPGDTLTVSGQIVDIEEQPTSALVTATVSVSNQDGLEVLSARTTASVPYHSH